MGKRDIQVVPVPQDELQAWWNDLNEANQAFVKKKLGFLLELMQVQCQIPLIQALARCWDPNTVTFNIDGLEFAPTLEEYSVICEF